MSGDDLYEYQDLPAEPEPVDENSLSFILGKALQDIDAIGGVTRAKLADLVGRDNGIEQALLARERPFRPKVVP
jgi:hypothetical protein